jgi:hypothetical protein
LSRPQFAYLLSSADRPTSFGTSVALGRTNRAPFKAAPRAERRQGSDARCKDAGSRHQRLNACAPGSQLRHQPSRRGLVECASRRAAAAVRPPSEVTPSLVVLPLMHAAGIRANKDQPHSVHGGRDFCLEKHGANLRALGALDGLPLQRRICDDIVRNFGQLVAAGDNRARGEGGGLAAAVGAL